MFVKVKHRMCVFHIHVHIPNGRHHFCTERRVPPCAAGRGCTDSFVSTKFENIMKREASFLHGEEGATLCSGEGLHR